MANYDDMFNVDDVPSTQTSSYTAKPQSKSPVTNAPHQIDEEHYTQDNKTKTVVICVIAVLILAFVFFLPTGDKSTPEVTPSRGSIISTINKGSSTIDFESVEEVDTSQDALHWVNYEKKLYKNSNNVLGYYIVCSSPTLGNFETSLSRQSFVAIPEAGILPLVVTEVQFKGDDKTYYTNFRLHKNWENLLDGNVK